MSVEPDRPRRARVRAAVAGVYLLGYAALLAVFGSAAASGGWQTWLVGPVVAGAAGAVSMGAVVAANVRLASAGAGKAPAAGALVVLAAGVVGLLIFGASLVARANGSTGGQTLPALALGIVATVLAFPVAVATLKASSADRPVRRP